MPSVTPWSDERVEALKRGFAAGDSFACIARDIGGGISRSACIGKAARLKLERAGDKREFHRLASKIATAARVPCANEGFGGRPKAPPVARANAQNNGLNFRGPPARPAGLRALAAFEPSLEGMVKMVEVERRHCRWPFGDPETTDFRFCGARRVQGAYCAAHARRAYISVPESENLERLFGRLA